MSRLQLNRWQKLYRRLVQNRGKDVSAFKKEVYWRQKFLS